MRSHPAATLRLEHERHVSVASKRRVIKLIVVDEHCSVYFDSIDANEHDLRLLLSDDRTKLRSNVGSVTKSLIDDCTTSGQRHSKVAFIDSNRSVRVTRLNGGEPSLYAVQLEYFRGGDSLSRAARKYQLTPREIDVLAMILEGANATEIAQSLKIAETTVQGYYKRLLIKTQARNRPAMVANVLGWDSGMHARGRSSEVGSSLEVR
jgi:DNA-binding CsgD family transcriptional regulator